MVLVRSTWLVVVLICGGLVVPEVGAAQAGETDDDPCQQSSEERDKMLKEAEDEQFNVRFVEFLGNNNRRGRDFFKRTTTIGEGDVFTRTNLDIAVKRVARMKTIKPITIDNLKIRLDQDQKVINILICVTEKS